MDELCGFCPGGEGRGTVKIREKRNIEIQETDNSKEDDKNIKQGILKRILKAFKCLMCTYYSVSCGQIREVCDLIFVVKSCIKYGCGPFSLETLFFFKFHQRTKQFW